MMRALSYCKVICSKLRAWNAEHGHGFPIDGKCRVNIVKELEDYLKSSCKKDEISEQLNEMLRYAHIWIPPEKRRLYIEDRKAYVSVNTAAIKHILLSAALDNPEAFAAKENMKLVVDLMQKAFETLGDPSEFDCPHAFLDGERIPHMSVLASLEEQMMFSTAMEMKEQCRILKAKALTKVRGNFQHHMWVIQNILN